MELVITRTDPIKLHAPLTRVHEVNISPLPSHPDPYPGLTPQFG
jgi:hypothetical protein